MAARRWTAAEDAAIRAACARTRATGMVEEDADSSRHEGRAKRLQAVAETTGRTLAAVRKRAQRLGERSYRPSWITNEPAARERQRKLLAEAAAADR